MEQILSFKNSLYDKGTMANSVDQDQNAASDQGLHCLH